MDQERGSYPVELRCPPLAVSAARYYAWRKQQQPAPTQSVAANWEEALKDRRCYGTRRLRVELQAQGYRVGRQRLRATTGCGPCSPQASSPRITDSTHGLRCAPSRLLG